MRLSSARVFFTAVFFALPWLAYAQAPAASPRNQPATAEMSQSPVPAISKQDATTSPSVGVEPARPSDAKSREAIAPAVTPTIGMHELSPWSMFLNADIIVKIVMCGLAFASLMTWTVLIAKTTELLNSRRSLKASLKRILTAGSLNEAQELVGSKPNVLATFLSAAMLEADLSRAVGAGKEDGVKERVASSFAEITRNEGRSVRRGMGLLATIGSTSPFVGLFGTVWGIMNSFIGISKSQTTNLAVVAPGIAEALLATAIGLMAAIPAVIIYNHFSRQMRAYLDVVAQASGAAGRLLSRDLDSRRETTFRQAAE